MAVEAAFSQDGGNGFCFCFIELVMTEVALWKDVLEGGKIDSMIGQRSAVAGKAPCGNKDCLLLGFFD